MAFQCSVGMVRGMAKYMVHHGPSGVRVLGSRLLAVQWTERKTHMLLTRLSVHVSSGDRATLAQKARRRADFWDEVPIRDMFVIPQANPCFRDMHLFGCGSIVVSLTATLLSLKPVFDLTQHIVSCEGALVIHMCVMLGSGVCGSLIPVWLAKKRLRDMWLAVSADCSAETPSVDVLGAAELLLMVEACGYKQDDLVPVIEDPAHGKA
jgi:hypothetical protein